MSLSKTIFDNIETNIKLYISQISSKYKLDENDLYKMWNNNSEYDKPISAKIQSKPIIKDEDSLDPELMKLNKKELAEICKSKNLTVSGTKAEIVKRIMNGQSSGKTSSLTKNTPSKNEQPSIIKKLAEKIQPIQIKRNSFGNFEHSDSGLVINNVTKKAYGTQNSDGTVSELTLEDIDLCHKYKFVYDLPENLNKNNDDDEDDVDDEVEEVDEDAAEEELDEEDCLDDDDDDDIEVEEELEDEYYDEE